MAFTRITITHTFLNADGTAASGTVRFSLSGRMTNGVNSVMPSQAVSSALNGSGQLSVSLPANDDAATTPLGQTWQVAIEIIGCSVEEYVITVPSAAPGGTIDLGSLLPEAQQVG